MNEAEQIKQTLSAKEYAERYLGLEIKGNRSAAVWRGGDGPSNVSYSDDGAWYDHKEKAGGSVIDLCARHRFNGDIKKAIEFLSGELHIKQEPQKPASKGRSRKYVYTDESGEPIAYAKRWYNEKGKQFTQYDAKTGKPSVKHLGVIPLYNLPNVVNSTYVFVVEGEKDADTINAMGLVATTNIGGSSKWKEEHSKTLAGKQVTILYDNDDPGRKHASVVARSVLEEGCKVKALCLSKIEKGDVTDWIEKEGGNENLLRELVLEAPFVHSPEEIEGSKHVEVVKINPPTSLLALPRPEYGNDPSEIIQNRFLYRGGICILSAPTGVGKSSFIMQWAMHLATCRDYFGLRIGGYYKGKNLRVLVIQAENDEYDLCECRDGVVMACGEQMATDADPHLSFVTMPDACGPEFAARLDAHCHVFKPDVVFIDPVFSFLGGDNSAQKDVTHWVRNLINPVLMRHKVACIITHHVNKPQKDKIETGAYNMSGSAEWANSARCCLAFEKASEGLYYLVATKRGQRLGWKNDAGERVLKRLIAYHGGEDEHGRPIIAWREASAEECEAADGSTNDTKRVKTTVSDLLGEMPSKELIGHGELVRKVMKASGASERAVRSHIKEAVELGLVIEYKAGKTKSYVKNDLNKNVG